MYCPNCGAKLEEHANFCSTCGAPVRRVSVPQPEPVPKPEPVPHEREQTARRRHYPEEFKNFDVEFIPKKKNPLKKILLILCIAVAVVLISFIIYRLDALGVVHVPSIIPPTEAPTAAPTLPPTEPPTEPPPTEAPTEPVTTVRRALVTDGVGRAVQDVKKDLEDLGFVVSIEETTSETVSRGKVVRQSVDPGTITEVGTHITLYASSGVSKTPVNYRQKLVISPTGGGYATAGLYNYVSGSWELQASYDAAVGMNGVGFVTEGGKTTPQGVYPLGVVLTSRTVDTKMTVKKVSSDTVIVDDAGFPNLYNRIMDKRDVPSGCSTDRIGKNLTDGTLNAVIFINFNGDGFSKCDVVGGGSAIGLRGNADGVSPTYGDVDISASDMTDLLSRLDPSKNPHIVIDY
ncbi:MAG: PASTA domain-containing protein [Ruminococcus sp.]|nr:PASTA domain-containing protein [Ruminococcus sp.]